MIFKNFWILFFLKGGGRPNPAQSQANYFGRCMQNEFCMQQLQQWTMGTVDARQGWRTT
jgi:hypothetical protein